MADMNRDTALWNSISSKHHSIFRILYNAAAQCDPHTAGDLLCTAAERDDTTVMKELLKQGLDVDSKDRHGKTAIQIALAKNNVEMVKLLVGNGADVMNAKTNEFPPAALSEILQGREVGHRITVADAGINGVVLARHEGDQQCPRHVCPRVSIYRGNPVVRRETGCVEAGRLIRLPASMEELKNIAGTYVLMSAAQSLY
jgi:hypothetical protein